MKNEWLWPCYVRKSNSGLIHGRRLYGLPGLIFITKSPMLARHTAVLVMKDGWCHCHEVTLLVPVFLSSQAEVAIVEESDLVSVLALPLAHSLPRIRKLLPLLGLCFFFFFFLMLICNLGLRIRSPKIILEDNVCEDAQLAAWHM